MSCILGKSRRCRNALRIQSTRIHLASFVFLAIQTAVIVDKFWRVSKDQIAKENKKERQGLMRAFALLDSSGSGFVTMPVWEGFLKHLMPHASATEARQRTRAIPG